MKHIHTFESFLNESVTNPRYTEFMLEWEISGKESNTRLDKSLRVLLDYVEDNNIKQYTIKGRDNNKNKWDLLISNIPIK